MAKLTKEAYGEGALKGVGLIITAYDNRKAENKAGEPVHYVVPFIHPDDPRAVGQVVPELRNEHNRQTGKYEKGMALQDVQLEALKENSESFPQIDKDGNRTGTNYVTRADLMVKGQKPNSYLMPNSKTFQADPSLSAEPEAVTRSWELRAEASAAQEAAKKAKETKAAKEAPEAAVDDKKAARSAAAKKAAATRRANKEAAAAAAEASVDEPGLG